MRGRRAIGGRRGGIVALALAWVLGGCGLFSEPDRPPERLALLQFNDHYILEPVDRQRGGMARIASLVAGVRAESPHTLLALAGDTISPSIMSSVLQGEQMVAAWNLLGLDVATFGNHEFDFGPVVLLERMRESRFTWLSANVFDRSSGRPFGGARSERLVERGRAAVGFFGLTMPETAETSSPGPGIEFREPIASAQAAVARLRAHARPVLVAVTHQPMPADEALARAIPGLHLVIGGHEHDPLEQVIGETLITKAGSDGVFVVRVDLQATHDGRVLSRHHRFIPVTAEIPEDTAMAALVARYAHRLTQALDVPVGDTREPLDARAHTLRTGESNVGNLVADVIRSLLRADVGLMNGGGIRTNRIIPAGRLARKDIHALLPFLNVLVKLEVTGATLLAALERSVSAYPGETGGFLQVSGMTVAFDPARPASERVVRLTVGGAPVDLGRHYTVATNSYLARGGDGYTMLQAGRVLIGPEDGPGLVEALVEAVERAGVVEPRVEGRVQRVP
ncbi:MAG: 5'-nucleotidase C-terminal domain-containing protein [Candidatus Rokubacteria bacterium]|nr:5'-nucleotidase C-terminal domain-containing protein [Candidatus Rokubacteria bacterium]